ncbi:GTP-binding protein 2 [Halotydeus destructor]|nr:GTP-binding protein 2 [Halotydeus destructor]
MAADFIGLFGPSCEDDDDTFDNLLMASGEDLPDALPPECSEGNVEYKLKLINPSETRFEHLVTQMKWRLREGHGEAIYEIGVEDKGMLIGLNEDEVEASLHTLYMMSQKLGATMTILRERDIRISDEPSRRALEVLIRKVPDDQQSIELRIAVLGNVDVGKSTLLGVLTQGELDNGRGSSRLNLFRHRHEIQSGRTSSISREILGFSSTGAPVTYSICRTPEEICEASSKLITFIDLAGHQKYLRTTVFGLMGHLPHFALLLVSAVSGVAGTTKEHFGLAMALELPVIVVINKVDLVSAEALRKTTEQIEAYLKSPLCKKIPMILNSDDDALTAASSISSGNIVPIVYVSNVTGHGLDLLYTFFNVLPPCISNRERENLMQLEPEFQIDETFQVVHTGLVAGGLLVSGVIRIGDWLNMGPLQDGSFTPVQVTSVHRHKVPCRLVRAGESATLALADNASATLYKDLRKGMVLTASMSTPPCFYFQARITVLNHKTVISPGFQVTVHTGNVRQTAAIVAIMGKQGLTTSESASVMFRFLKYPECLHTGCRMLFRQGSSKGIGQVLQTFPVTAEEPSVHEK